MSDDIPASLAEAMAEIRRSREVELGRSMQARHNTYVPPEYVSIPKAQFEEMAAHIDRLQARVAELEGRAAITFGTLEQPTPDEPATYTHNVLPSAPPHNE